MKLVLSDAGATTRPDLPDDKRRRSEGIRRTGERRGQTQRSLHGLEPQSLRCIVELALVQMLPVDLKVRRVHQCVVAEYVHVPILLRFGVDTRTLDGVALVFFVLRICMRRNADLANAVFAFASVYDNSEGDEVMYVEDDAFMELTERGDHSGVVA